VKIAVAGGSGGVGRYVVEAAGRAGHDVTVLSRSTGVDLLSGVGLQAALANVEVIIDTINTSSTSRAKAMTFFTEATRHLQTAGAAQNVDRLVTLSIVGLERARSYGYYTAKLEHEAAARSGPLPVSIVRATQFHEFPAQILARTQMGPFAVVPRMKIQQIAARTVGQALVDVATKPTGAQIVEVAGPEAADLVDLVRTLIAHWGQRVVVIPLHVPGAAGKAMRLGAMLPTPDVPATGPAFSQWLNSPDCPTRN
jgi:uncharacterized protein YbjT (DUF2867 family)